MAHPLEKSYGLSASEILDAVSKRFRLRAALEGAVAEVQMERHIQVLLGSSIDRYVTHDLDGQPDFSIWLPNIEKPLRAECKNVRESSKEGGEAYREGGKSSPTKSKHKKRARHKVILRADFMVSTNSRFLVSVWEKRRAIGPTSFMRKLPTWRDMRRM